MELGGEGGEITQLRARCGRVIKSKPTGQNEVDNHGIVAE